MKHPTVELVKDIIREPYAWPGGYAKSLVMADGCLLCKTCIRENFRLIAAATKQNMRDGWCAAGVMVYWEGPPEHCANCNKVINSEYGDPEAEDEVERDTPPDSGNSAGTGDAQPVQ